MSISTVCPDEVETGRVQGRQMRALVPAGRRVLYIQGSPRSLASRQRTAGMQEATAGAPFEVVLAGGDWNPAFASRTVREWLRFAVGGRRPFDLVACQNDHMAGGALEALAAAAAESGQKDVGAIPVTGCDGAPDIGQKMVRDGRLVATVVLPRVAGPAVDEIAALLASGTRPAPVITHAATSFPPLGDLAADRLRRRPWRRTRPSTSRDPPGASRRSSCARRRRPSRRPSSATRTRSTAG